MNTKERIVSYLDGVLLAVVMLWTITIAAELVSPSIQQSSSTELHAPLAKQL